MKQLTIVLLLTMAGHFCYGQNKNLNTKYAVKVYNLSSLQKQEEPYAQGIYTGHTEQKDLQLFHPTVAFRIRNQRNNFHEIELTKLEVGSEETLSSINFNNGTPIVMNGGKTNTTAIALRYEYIINFLKKKNSKFMPAVGLGLMPYYQRTNYTPSLATEFPQSATRLGAKGFITPRLNYAISSRLFVDINIPICVTDMYTLMNKEQNPNLTAEQQKNSTGNFDGLPKFYSLRIGLGLNI
jgi:hypothetical protein